MNSPAYAFLLNMWIMRKVNEEYLQARVLKGQITQEEYNMIVVTPQMEVDEFGNVIVAVAPLQV